MVGEDRPQMTM